MAGFDNLNPAFASQLQAMIQAAAAEGRTIGIGSGHRTVEQQIALRKSNGCPDVWSSPASSCRVPTAIPGKSRHNMGLAADITGDKQWANANAHRFGLHFNVTGEDWHVEPINLEGMEAGGGGGAVDQWGRPISFGFEYMDEPGNPEDELTNRLNSIMQIISSGTPDIETPEDMTEPLGMDTTVIPSDQTFTRQEAGGGAAASGDKLGNARTIVQVGRELGMPDRAIQIALAAALVESELENVNYGDRDSLGLFQQRPSQGWGSPQQVMNPQYAARKFFEGLSGVNWQGMDPGAAAQAVQRSAYPDRYGKRWSEAQSIFNQVSGF